MANTPETPAAEKGSKKSTPKELFKRLLSGNGENGDEEREDAMTAIKGETFKQVERVRQGSGLSRTAAVAALVDAGFDHFIKEQRNNGTAGATVTR